MLWLIVCMININPTLSQFSDGSTEESHTTDGMPAWGNAYVTPFQHNNNFGMTQPTNTGNDAGQLSKLLSDFYSATYWQHYNRLMATRTTTTLAPPTTVHVPTRPNYQAFGSFRLTLPSPNTQFQNYIPVHIPTTPSSQPYDISKQNMPVVNTDYQSYSAVKGPTTPSSQPFDTYRQNMPLANTQYQSFTAIKGPSTPSSQPFDLHRQNMPSANTEFQRYKTVQAPTTPSYQSFDASRQKMHSTNTKYQSYSAVKVPTTPTYQPFDYNIKNVPSGNNQFQSHTNFHTPKNTVRSPETYQIPTTQKPMTYHTTTPSAQTPPGQHWQVDRSHSTGSSWSDSTQRYSDKNWYQESYNHLPNQRRNQFMRREPARQETSTGSNGSVEPVQQLYKLLYWNAMAQNSKVQHGPTNNFG